MKNELLNEDLAWCIRKLPTLLREFLQGEGCKYKVFISGGFVRSCVSGEAISDVDLFVDSLESARHVAGILEMKDFPLIETENAFTIRGYRYTIQVIHRWQYSDPIDCL